MSVPDGGNVFIMFEEICRSKSYYYSLSAHPPHPAPTDPSRLVSTVYSTFHRASCEPPPIDRLWKAEYFSNSCKLNCKLKQNMQLSSRKSNHQIMYSYNSIHRIFFPPRMNWKPFGSCTLCTQSALCTFNARWASVQQLHEFFKRLFTDTVKHPV